MRQRGFALLPVLWASVLLALVAAAVATAMRAETGIARVQRSQAEGRAIADAAIHLAIARLMAADATQHPRLDGSPLVILFDDQPVLLRLQDETGKVDLNLAAAPVLRRYFDVALGGDPLAEALATQVLERRRPGPGRQRFLSVAELALLPGVTPALLAQLAPGLTVYSQQPGPDPATAVPGALLALPGMTPEEVARILVVRQQPDAGLPIAGVRRDVLGAAVEIQADLDRAGLRIRRRAVVRTVADPARPLWVYAWE